jgi:hypothetical protein
MSENEDVVHYTKRAFGYVAEVGCRLNGCKTWLSANGGSKAEAKEHVLAKLTTHRLKEHS